jgi:hypothetical protein
MNPAYRLMLATLVDEPFDDKAAAAGRLRSWSERFLEMLGWPARRLS